MSRCIVSLRRSRIRWAVRWGDCEGAGICRNNGICAKTPQLNRMGEPAPATLARCPPLHHPLTSIARVVTGPSAQHKSLTGVAAGGRALLP